MTRCVCDLRDSFLTNRKQNLARKLSQRSIQSSFSPPILCGENIIYEDTKHIKTRNRFRNRDEEMKTQIEILVLLAHLVTCKDVYKLRVTCYHMSLEEGVQKKSVFRMFAHIHTNCDLLCVLYYCFPRVHLPTVRMQAVYLTRESAG